MVSIILAVPFVIAFIGYLSAVNMSNKNYRKWPVYKSIFWTGGSLCAIMTLIGPIAKAAHESFLVHMIGHLFLGMLAPLLMVLASPMTLLLRTLPTQAARRLTQLLRHLPFKVLMHPVTATILNMGGLWLLYMTDVFLFMQKNALLHIFIHIHVFIAGYVWTASMIYFDPMLHTYSYRYRSVVCLTAIASHQILAKFIYAYPPTGIPSSEAEMGALFMFYGGDAIDLVIIIILIKQWYYAARPRPALDRNLAAET